MRVRLVLTVSLLLSTSGCYFVRHKTVPVQVVDGETGLPIAGAKVAIATPAGLWPRYPVKRGRSDNNGMLKIGVPNPKDVTLFTTMYVEAAGYPPSQLLPPPYPASIANLTIAKLYHDPEAVVRLIIPDDYRGPIEVIYAPTEVNAPLGQREFVYVLPSNGKTIIDATPVIRRTKFIYADWSDSLMLVDPAGTRLRKLTAGTTDDGSIRWDIADDAVAIRELSTPPSAEFGYEKRRVMFVRGTAADWRVAQSKLWDAK